MSDEPNRVPFKRCESLVGMKKSEYDALVAERDELREASAELLRLTNPFFKASSLVDEMHNARKRLDAIINSPEGREGGSVTDDPLFECEECGGIYHRSESLAAPNPFDPTDVLSGCPRCKAVDKAALLCDEAGCRDRVSCGFPTPGGYRHTCSKHYRKLKPTTTPPAGGEESK